MHAVKQENVTSNSLIKPTSQISNKEKIKEKKKRDKFHTKVEGKGNKIIAS